MIDAFCGQNIWSNLLLMSTFAEIFSKLPHGHLIIRNYMSKPDIVLTSREYEVLYWLSQGYSSKEISKKLFISHNTVEYHRKQLLRKTSARNAAHLIGLAFRLRLLDIED